MANRHLARSIVMQTLFVFDFNQSAESSAREVLQYNIDEFGPGIEDPEFVESLLLGTLKKRAILDEIIEKAAPEWPVDKINAVDRNVLRLGLYELLFGNYDQVPPKVAINESIELAKSYGGESSGRFVNGVLGAVYKEIGEPGKTQQSKKHTRTEVAYEDMPIDQKAGAVVYSLHNGQYYLAMIHDVFGFWTLSKSGVQENVGETPEAATVRALKEEMNLDINIIKKIGENEYIANHPERGRVRKHVMYFLAEAPYGEIKLEEDAGGIDDGRWFLLDDVLQLRMYDDVTQLIAKAASELLGQHKSDTVQEE